MIIKTIDASSISFAEFISELPSEILQIFNIYKSNNTCFILQDSGNLISFEFDLIEKIEVSKEGVLIITTLGHIGLFYKNVLISHIYKQNKK